MFVILYFCVSVCGRDNMPVLTCSKIKTLGFTPVQLSLGPLSGCSEGGKQSCHF